MPGQTLVWEQWQALYDSLETDFPAFFNKALGKYDLTKDMQNFQAYSMALKYYGTERQKSSVTSVQIAKMAPGPQRDQSKQGLIAKIKADTDNITKGHKNVRPYLQDLVSRMPKLVEVIQTQYLGQPQVPSPAVNAQLRDLVGVLKAFQPQAETHLKSFPEILAKLNSQYPVTM